MDLPAFYNSTIGADYLKTGQVYPIDLLLDYLHGLMAMKVDCADNDLWQKKYADEISAVKEILKQQTNGEHAQA